MEISEKAPAKLNLSLDTLYRHHTGDPEWDMVMTAIDLSDYVTITTKETQSSPQITVETDSGFLPCDQRNLAFQAAATLKNKFNIPHDVKIHIKKNIPVAAGMGGGSADAAAVLRGLNQLWQLGLSHKELAQIGLQIDSDVPFCVYSQTARVSGRGEVITPLEPLPPLWLVVAKIKASVSTPRILRQIDYEELDHQNTDAVVAAIQNHDLAGICANMGNSLERITSSRSKKPCSNLALWLRKWAELVQPFLGFAESKLKLIMFTIVYGAFVKTSMLSAPYANHNSHLQ